MSDLFYDRGPSEDAARTPTVPAFLEVAPSHFKPLDRCSREEIEATILSMTMQAQALVEEATNLGRYLDGEIKLGDAL